MGYNANIALDAGYMKITINHERLMGRIDFLFGALSDRPEASVLSSKSGIDRGGFAIANWTSPKLVARKLRLENADLRIFNRSGDSILDVRTYCFSRDEV